MDDSKIYAFQCEKAEEIQKQRNHNWGSWYFVEGKIVICEYTEIRTWKEDAIWLPRQDELQKMSNKNWWDFDLLCMEVAKDYTKKYGGMSSYVLHAVKSKEIASLMAVMKEKYGKVWDGKDWVRE